MGEGRYMACCPAHADRSPSLSIKYTGERILLRCFAGCETGDVLAAVGLAWADVMPPSTEHEKAAYKRAKNAQRLHRVLEHERLVLAIAQNQTAPLSGEDAARVRLAKTRIEKIQGAPYGQHSPA
jgi:hypothetical protein